MKMREELELYKGRTAELEAYTARLIGEHTAALTANQATQEQEMAALVIAHNVEVSELTSTHKKAIESKDGSIKYKNDQVSELTEQVNNLHDILDVIPGVMSRKKGEDSYGAENKCHVRLASVLAQKFM